MTKLKNFWIEFKQYLDWTSFITLIVLANIICLFFVTNPIHFLVFNGIVLLLTVQNFYEDKVKKQRKIARQKLDEPKWKAFIDNASKEEIFEKVKSKRFE